MRGAQGGFSFGINDKNPLIKQDPTDLAKLNTRFLVYYENDAHRTCGSRGLGKYTHGPFKRYKCPNDQPTYPVPLTLPALLVFGTMM